MGEREVEVGEDFQCPKQTQLQFRWEKQSDETVCGNA